MAHFDQFSSMCAYVSAIFVANFFRMAQSRPRLHPAQADLSESSLTPKNDRFEIFDGTTQILA
jgi:hypothetical protein